MKNSNKVAPWLKRIVFLMLIVIILTLFAPVIYMLFAFMTKKYTTIHVYQDESSIGVLLSLVGIAVTAWVGLNIYNVFNRNELLEIIDEAKKSMDLVSQENYISKLRNSFSDHAGVYFAERIEDVDVLPKPLIEELIEFQDIYNNQHDEYRKISSTDENWKGIQFGKRIVKDISEGKYILTNSTKILLMGYVYFCLGLMEYSPVQYSEGVTKDSSLSSLRDVVRYEKTALKYLFSIESPEKIKSVYSYDPNERKVIALTCNCIGSIYLVAFNSEVRKSIYTNDEILESVSYMELAVRFSDVTAAYIKEIFYRNLGSAYMMQGNYKHAYKALVDAFNYNRNNPKISIGFGQYYINQIKRIRPGLINISDDRNISVNNDILSHTTDSEKMDIIKHMDSALFWYEQHFRYGFNDDFFRIKTLANTLYQLTNDDIYLFVEKYSLRVYNCMKFTNADN